MTFLHPWLLAGIATAALPIVLHLVMRQKPRPVVFPAMRLVQRRSSANRKRLRLRHLLLLALRMAALSLLAMALARPSMQASSLGADQESPVAAVLVFDTAPQMLYRQDNQTRIERAQQEGAWLLTQLPRDSQAAVLDSQLGSAVFQVDIAAAAQRISRLSPAAAARPLADVLVEAARLLSENPLARKELYVFTDLAKQRFAGGAIDAARKRFAALPDRGIYVIDVGSRASRDVALGALELSSEVVPKSGNLGVSIEVRSEGGAASRPIELWIEGADGQSEKRSEQLLELPANGSSRVEFPPLAIDSGTRQGLVKLLGQDGLSANDVRYFTLVGSPAWQVALVGGDEKSVRYVSEALAPAAFRKTGRARFECRNWTTEDLASQALGPMAVLWLLDPPPLTPEVWTKLAAYVAAGGGLAIALGPAAVPVESFNSPGAQELLPAPLVEQSRHPDGDVFFAPQDESHPIARRFARVGSGIPWDGFPVFRYWQLGDLASTARLAARFSDGEPALVERTIDRGRVLVLCTSLSPRAGEEPWNQLPTGLDAWPFVMLTNEMTQYLAGAGSESLNYRAGQTVVLKPRGAQAIEGYLLTSPDGRSERRVIDRRQDAIVVSAATAVGNYLIRAGGGQEALDAGFSVNLAPEATELARLSDAELKAFWGDVPYRVANSREEIHRDISLGRVGRELFGWIMLVLVAVMALENAMANRFYRDEANDAPLVVAERAESESPGHGAPARESAKPATTAPHPPRTPARAGRR